MKKTISELINRQSVRIFTNKPISREDKNLIIESAINAPTAGNMQLYSIINVKDKKKINRLVELCDHQDFIKKAKMILIFCADYQKWYDAFLEANLHIRKPDTGDLLLSMEDAIIAAQNSVTAAQSLGIGSCYIGDIMENFEEVISLLSLPKYVYPACMVVYGYPDKMHVQKYKPKRFNNKYVVFNDDYKKLDKNDIRRMFKERVKPKSFDEWMKSFAERKFDSDFSKEMSRSANLYIDRYKK